jgi:hypothetical protein
MAAISALVYVLISIGSGAIFFITSAGYPLVARAGGTAWVALLTLIVAMPLVITGVKKRIQAGA